MYFGKIGAWWLKRSFSELKKLSEKIVSQNIGILLALLG
jgi:hypothetical protein